MTQMNQNKNPLELLRGEITRTDAELLRLFDQRMELAGQIGKIKAEAGIPVLDPAREEAVLANARSVSRHPEAAAEMMKTLMRVSRELQNLK